MRIFIIVVMSLSSLCVRAQSYPRTEISASLSTYDNRVPYGSYYLTDSIFPATGLYKSNGCGFGLITKFYRSPGAAFRIKMFLYSKEITDKLELYSPVHRLEEKSFSQRYLRVTPGFQWSMQQNKVEFFCGIEIPLTYIGNTDYYSNVEVTDVLNGVETIDRYDTRIPGGWGIAGGLFGGSTFHLNEYFFFGIEVNGYYGYSSAGGVTTTLGESYVNGAPVASDYSFSDKQVKITDFSTINALFNIGVSF